MTNTKFRKRALLSSVAMLLVALVALGSATFAWFAADPDARTSGINLKATSSIGLLVQSETEQAVCAASNGTLNAADYWSHDAVLRASSYTAGAFVTNATALPVSAASINCDAADTTANKGKIFQVPADDEGASTASSDANAVEEAINGSHYYGEKLYMKVTGSESATVTIKKVTLTPNSNNNAHFKNAVRVAITDKTGKFLGIWKPTGGTDNTYLKEAGTYSDVVSSSAYTGLVSAASTDIEVGSVGSDGTDYINVYVFLDGEDSAVYSQNISSYDLASIISNVAVELHAA